ncbi:hypothetical protein Ancab_028413 [Ancistrocladus abbreviatus]
MADSIIQYLVQTVGDFLQQEVTRLLGVEREVQNLGNRLKAINGFLRDSEGKRDENDEVRDLIQQIKDVAYEAEDVIEDYMLTAENHRRMNKLDKFLKGGKHLLFRHAVAGKIKEIDETITKIYEDSDRYGIKKNGGDENSDPAHPRPKSLTAVQKRRRDVEKDMVGRKDEADDITTKLITGRPDLDFVSIWGMPGLGKTTLARKIYNDVAIRNHFTCRGWVFVSEEYDTRQVILGIMKTVMPERNPEALEQKSEEELKSMLCNCLKHERYLVVLDDIWKPEMWDEISQCFPDEGKRSRIMITTRYKKVADHVCPNSAKQLRKLKFEEGWELFSRKVFRGQTCPPGLQRLAEDIVRECDGLPLSIVVMAGFLAGENAPNKWRRTRDNANSIIAADRTISDILALSYHDLPREVKPCFLYFAAFPEDFEVPARQLIRLWVGEGFIQKVGTRRMEDIAEDYLENLIDRSLVQAEKFRMDGGVKTCRIHDLLREFCIKEAAKEKFLESRKEVNPSNSSTSNPRRLSVQCNVPNFIWYNSSKLTRVRSIQSFDLGSTSKVNKTHWEKVNEGKLLRVLDFGSIIKVEDVPNEAKELLNLRYLKINAPSLRKFPTSLVSLWNLQTLDMRSTKLENVPDEIYRIENLRHLFLSGAVKFPKLSSDAPCPPWSLQTLSTVAPGQGIATLMERGVLASVTGLGLCDSSPKADWSLLAALQKLQKLESLKIESQINDSSIRKKLDPNWFPASLIKVTLRHTVLNSMEFEIFGKLPELQVLKICDTWSNLIFRRDSFPQLQTLSMASVTVQSWVLEEKASPRLERLIFDNCNFSCELPNEALTALPHLKVIRAMRPQGKLKGGMEKIKPDIIRKGGSVVILP